MDKTTQDFIAGKRIALVGVSRSGKKFGNIALKELQGRGYQVLPVHPTAAEIDGMKCYPNLEAVRGQADGVFVSVQPAEAEKVVREAAQAGFKQVWIQAGGESPAVLQAAQELGVQLITQKCILMYATPVKGFHGIHRGFAKLFGQF